MPRSGSYRREPPGAVAVNYVEAVAFEKTGGAITGVRALDRVGRRAAYSRQAGPQRDRAVGRCRVPPGRRRGGPAPAPTKGVHLVLPGRRLKSALLLLHPRDGRVFFVIPWLGKTLLGTTDTLAQEGPDALTVTAEDTAYLREAYAHYFPHDDAAPTLGSFVGLRPLLRARTSDPSAMSREFRVFRTASGMLSVAGGKYTTYRAMAEKITNRLERRLGSKRRCRMRYLPLGSTPPEAWQNIARGMVRQVMIRAALARTWPSGWSIVMAAASRKCCLM